MREKDITGAAIVRAWEITEFWKMEIYKGCWCWNGKKKFLIGDNDTLKQWKNDNTITPIPSISDCLEKLRELRALSAFGGEATKAITAFLMGQITIVELHEALLSALLKVLRG